MPPPREGARPTPKRQRPCFALSRCQKVFTELNSILWQLCLPPMLGNCVYRLPLPPSFPVRNHPCSQRHARWSSKRRGCKSVLGWLSQQLAMVIISKDERGGDMRQCQGSPRTDVVHSFVVHTSCNLVSGSVAFSPVREQRRITGNRNIR